MTRLGYSPRYMSSWAEVANKNRQQAEDFGLRVYYDDKAGVYEIPKDDFDADSELQKHVFDLLIHGKVYTVDKRDRVVVDQSEHFVMDVVDYGEDVVITVYVPEN